MIHPSDIKSRKNFSFEHWICEVFRKANKIILLTIPLFSLLFWHLQIECILPCSTLWKNRRNGSIWTSNSNFLSLRNRNSYSSHIPPEKGIHHLSSLVESGPHPALDAPQGQAQGNRSSREEANPTALFSLHRSRRSQFSFRKEKRIELTLSGVSHIGMWPLSPTTISVEFLIIRWKYSPTEGGNMRSLFPQSRRVEWSIRLRSSL